MTDAMPYFGEFGLLGRLRRDRRAPLNFHTGEYRVIEPDSPDLPETIGFSEYLYEADVVINLPLMKTHFNTLVTLGTKNLKGCLRPIDKEAFHEMELNAALAEVNRLLKPEITATVIDATTAMEGMGPARRDARGHGPARRLPDVVAAALRRLRLMGIDPAQARLIRFCAERGVGEMDLAKIEVAGETHRGPRRRFRLPFEALAGDFPELQLVGEHACSGCMPNLFRAMEIARHHGQEFHCDTVVIGPSVVTSEGETLLVGQVHVGRLGQARPTSRLPAARRGGSGRADGDRDAGGRAAELKMGSVLFSVYESCGCARCPAHGTATAAGTLARAASLQLPQPLHLDLRDLRVRVPRVLAPQVRAETIGLPVASDPRFRPRPRRQGRPST